MERDFSLISWPHFVGFVKMHFGQPIRSNSLGELKALQRMGTVEEYRWRFLGMLSCCEGLTMHH